MRVLASLPLYPPGSLVGAWLSTHECLAHLAGRGHHVDVVTHLGGGEPYDYEGVHVHPGADPEPFAAAAEVIVSHLGDNSRGARLSAKAGKPSVVMVHGHPAEAAARWDRHRPALVVFNSLAGADACDWDGPSVIVHPPVVASRYRCEPGDRVTLVNLSILKGGAIFDLLARSLPNIPFLGVRGGYGPQVARALPNVDHMATVTDMRTVYGRTRVLLIPSVHETWGRVGVEAMTCGIPVIAHPTAGLRESLGPAGIFVDRGDLAGWRAAIAALVTDPGAWARASARSKARADQLDPAADLDRFEASLGAVA